jgi:uncharacterized protein (DUF1684 family)
MNAKDNLCMWKLLLVAVLSITLVSCDEDEGGSVSEYNEQEILELRQAKDEAFRSSTTSPLSEEKRSSFTGLRYFDPDESYVVEATYTPTTSGDTIMMQTSTDELRRAVRAGWLNFTLKGGTHRLAAYIFGGNEGTSFFVPFTDKTTGRETYSAGRYLDIPKLDGSEYVIDFNEAYNPYCAYSDRFSCPLVPKENNLDVAIRAGEKK